MTAKDTLYGYKGILIDMSSAFRDSDVGEKLKESSRLIDKFLKGDTWSLGNNETWPEKFGALKSDLESLLPSLTTEEQKAKVTKVIEGIVESAKAFEAEFAEPVAEFKEENQVLAEVSDHGVAYLLEFSEAMPEEELTAVIKAAKEAAVKNQNYDLAYDFREAEVALIKAAEKQQEK